MTSCLLILQNLFPSTPKERTRTSVPTKQHEEKVHQLIHGSDSGDEGELLGCLPTKLELLQFSTPAAEFDNCEQDQMEGAQGELLPDNVEELSEHEKTLVTDDHSPSNSETDQELSSQQESTGSRHYSV